MNHKRITILYKDKILGSAELSDVIWMSIGSDDIAFQLDSTDEVMKITLSLIQLITIE